LDKLTRRDLKSDKFVEEVGHTVEYLSEHRKQFVRYASVALVAVVAVAGVLYYRRSQAAVRQEALAKAIRLSDAPVAGNVSDPALTNFPTPEAKEKAVRQAFTDVATRFGGSAEGDYAEIQLAVMDAEAGKTGEASKRFHKVAGGGNEEYASMAKLSLAQILAAEGKTADAEALLRGLIQKPTLMVSKEQATLALARVLASSKPAEARKLLEPLVKEKRQAVSRNAETLLVSLPPAK